MPRPRERPELTPTVKALLGQVRELDRRASRLDRDAAKAREQRDDRLLALAELGFSEHELGREFGLAQSTIGDCLDRARARRGASGAPT